MILRCCLLLCCAATLCAAQFNPRVTATEIALNETVRCTFATTRPQIEVDIARELRTALELPSVVRDWRLVGAPEVTRHEKAQDVTVSLVLRPRHAGELALPVIPVAWLEGDRSVAFPGVTVAEHIVVGSETRELPTELQGIGGYTWGSELDAVLAVEPGNRLLPAPATTTVETAGGLVLGLAEGRLSSVALVAPALDLEAAMSSFIQRWGSPHEEAEGEATWLLGWLRIMASDVPSGVGVTIVHEGIAAQAARKRVASDVFQVLETGRGATATARTPAPQAPADEPSLPAPAQPADEPPRPAPAAEPTPDADPATEAEAAPAPKPEGDATAPLSMEEIEAELERRLDHD